MKTTVTACTQTEAQSHATPIWTRGGKPLEEVLQVKHKMLFTSVDVHDLIQEILAFVPEGMDEVCNKEAVKWLFEQFSNPEKAKVNACS